VFFLPNRPESTTFFNESERKLALERMNRDSSGDSGATVNKGMVQLASTSETQTLTGFSSAYLDGVEGLEGERIYLFQL
jgi:hypothetical protein